jgi:TolB-like protein/DNA-binding winged helix-turn-helix (wHTH) protein/Flp pilus assembly protein TadD
MEEQASADVVLFGGFRFDRRRGVLSRQNDDGRFVPVPIGSRALDILGLLIDRHGDLVSKDEILNTVWPGVVEDANVTVQISALRRVLDGGRSGPSLIQTIPARGYRLTMPVTRCDAGPPSSGVASDGPYPNSVTGSVVPATKSRARKGRWYHLAALSAVIVAAVAAWIWNRPQSAAPPLSMVVLPFDNLSNDLGQEYFVDAVTNDLTTDLSRISGTFVIARGTAFTYKGKSADAKQIGRELGVRYIIEGAVRPLGDHVQVNVQLVDAESAAQLWTDRFETDRRNLAEAESEIAGRLVKTLNFALIEAAGRRIEREGAANPDAHDVYLRGFARYLRGSGSPEAVLEAQRLYEQALKMDPESVEARAGIAGMLISKVADGWSSSLEEDEARAEQLLHEALERDPNNEIARSNIGILRRLQKRLPEAQIELERAIALNPNNTWSLRHLGITLMQLGRPEAGVSYIEKSIRLSPQDPFIWVNYLWLARCHFLLGHVDQAVGFFRKAYAANPRRGPDLWLAAALGLSGDLAEAKATLAEWLKFHPKLGSLAQVRTTSAAPLNPQFLELTEKTVEAGLRKAGMPEE